MATSQAAEVNLVVTADLIKNAVKDFPLSKRFTKIVVNCTILNILAQRMVVNGSELKKRHLDAVPFYVFKNPHKVKDEVFKSVLKWTDGIKDAIDKNFLKNIYLFIKNPKNNDILESYSLKLKYNFGQETEYKPTLIYVRSDTVALFEMLVKLGKYPKLQENAVVEIEFTYNDNTPMIYEPPGFEVAVEPFCKKFGNFKNHLGTVNTGYHKVILVENEMNQVNKKQDVNADTETETTKQTNTDYATTLNTMDLKSSVSKLPKKIILDDSIEDSIITLNSEDNTNKFIVDNCICSLSPSLVIPLINCTKCKKLFHAPCYGFIEEYESMYDFRCINCISTDVELKNLPPSDQTILARTRLILYFLKKDGVINKNVVDSFPKSIQEDIFKKIRDHNVILPDNSVNQEALSFLINAFTAGTDSQFLE